MTFNYIKNIFMSQNVKVFDKISVYNFKRITLYRNYTCIAIYHVILSTSCSLCIFWCILVALITSKIYKLPPVINLNKKVLIHTNCVR